MSTTTRDYVSETREVRVGGETYIVRAFSIVATSDVMFSAYVQTVGFDAYGTTMSDDAYGRLGLLRTKRPDDETLALPYGQERSERVQQHYRGLDAMSEEVIRSAFPEFVHIARFKDGHASMTTSEFRDYAVVPSEDQQLGSMTDREAVAYWNILQMGARTLTVGDDGGKAERHMESMDRILTARGIAHERGKLTSV